MNRLESLAALRPAMRPAPARPARGFSLVEMLITIAVAGVLVAAGLPEFSKFLRDTRLTSFASDLRSDLQFARSESIRRNARVLVCPSDNATPPNCVAAVVAATWANGWLICHDTDANGSCDASTAADPNPARIRAAPVAPLTLIGPAASVTFFPTGSATPAATFTITGGTSVTRTLGVAPSGNLTSTRY